MLVSLKCLNTKGQAHKLGSEGKGRSRGLEKTHSACMSTEDTWAIRTQTARDPLSGVGFPRTLLVLRGRRLKQALSIFLADHPELEAPREGGRAPSRERREAPAQPASAASPSRGTLHIEG